MSSYPVRLPDVGEGVAEAELVQWLVHVGDQVQAECPLAEVLTDKATVEIASPVSGVVLSLHGEPGDRLTVGAPLATLETADAEPAEPPAAPAADPAPMPAAAAAAAPVAAEPAPAAPGVVERAGISARAEVAHETDAGSNGSRPAKPLAAPAVRARAQQLGIDLGSVNGTGADGRVLHADLDALLGAPLRRPSTGASQQEPIRGVRRRIAERLTDAWEAPHITFVDDVDAEAVEALRSILNDRAGAKGTRFTLLPFLVRALTIACADHPRCNAHFDAAAETLTTFGAVHVGIATQTDNGLMVPVVHNAHELELDDIAREIARLSTAAREGKATADELTGSTITITSLGALGGIVTTPILNRPEVAIVGVNRMQVRPVWREGAFVPRTMFNLSSSFDHRIVDGYDAAVFVRRLKELLEQPALLFADRR